MDNLHLNGYETKALQIALGTTHDKKIYNLHLLIHLVVWSMLDLDY